MYTAQLLRYYFGSTGKAYKNSKGKTINGKKYGFDDDGKMLFGFVDSTLKIVNDDSDDPVLDCVYYYGTNEDGARHSGWLQYTDALSDDDYTEDYYWFYFNTSNGKKVESQTKSINGKKYCFDEKGVMNFKWSASTKVDNQTLTSWYGKLEDGALAKNQWIWNKPYSDAYLPGTRDDVDTETERWFRSDASGNLVKGQTKKINSKWYAFDEDGVMRTGLIRLVDKNGNPSTAVSSAKVLDAKCLDMDEVTGDQIKTPLTETSTAAQGGSLHYFSEDEEKDGSMKTGTMKIELADDEYTFCFTKTTGAAKHGYDSSSKKIYNNGILEKAGDDKYKVVANPGATAANKQSDKYLVGSTGSVVTSVNKYKDANDKYYVVLKPVAGSYDYQIGSTYDEDAAKKAVKDNSLAGLTIE